MVRRRPFILAGGAAFALALVACSGSNSKNTPAPSQSPPAAATAAAGAGGQAESPTAAAAAAASAAAAPKPASPTASIRRGGTLNLALAVDAKGFDPMTSNDTYSNAVASQIYDGLVQFDQNLSPVPWLAEKWEISADGKTYTFTLRKGVKFQDGTDFNAQAMKFSMDRIRANPASVGQSDCGPKIVTDTSVVDDFTFRLTLADPFAPFLTKLTGRCAAAVSPTAVQKQGDDDFALHPVGTGPFKLSEFKKDDHITVVKNDGYWRMGADGKPLPYLDKITWRVISDGKQRLQALATGDVDLLGASDLNYQDVPSVKSNQDLVYEQTIGFGWGGFMLNVSRPPFSNKALAQAVAFAIDRDEVNRVISNGIPPKAENGVIPPSLKWAVDESYVPYTYDAAKAKAKLAEGGQPNGFSFTILADTSDPLQQRSLELYQSQLKKVGIDMKIESGDFNSVVVKRGLAADFEAAGINITGGIDPDSWVYSAFHTGGNFNIPHLSDPQIDQLAEQGRQETDQAKRAEIYKQANKLIMDHSPWIMVSYRLDRYAARKNVKGVHVGPYPSDGLEEAWKASE